MVFIINRNEKLFGDVVKGELLYYDVTVAVTLQKH